MFLCPGSCYLAELKYLLVQRKKQKKHQVHKAQVPAHFALLNVSVAVTNQLVSTRVKQLVLIYTTF